MEIFTIRDYFNYLKCKENLKTKNLKSSYIPNQYLNNSYVCEEQENYNYFKKSNVNNEHDKIFRTVLADKLEVAKFINKTLQLKYPIKPEDLEKYNSSFITKQLRNQEADIVYKLKGRKVFFLIEHQTKVDYSMPYRILKYELEIIESSIDYKEINRKNYKYPTILPIVLYSGKRRWNGKTYLGEMQESIKSSEEEGLAKYNIVDVNDFSEEELLEDNSFLSKIMLIEKISHTENLVIYLEKIIEKITEQDKAYTKEQKELLNTIITTVLQRKLSDSQKEELRKKLNKKEGKNMLAVLEMIDEENARIEAKGVRKGIKKGRKEAQRETAKRMLNKKMDIKTIIEITDLTEKEILKLEKSLN